MPANSTPVETRRPRLFRDLAGLETLGPLVRRRLRGGLRRPLRAWVPECSTGEDAYSVAVRLLEALGTSWREVELKVFCTDSDPDAILHARTGRFPLAAAAAATAARRERFFSVEAHHVKVKPLVRAACRFLGHDLSQPAPFATLDLIVLRETLARLPHAARINALRLYHGALLPGGVLLDPTLSAAEAPDLFSPLGRAGAFTALPSPQGRKSLARRRGPDVETRLRESEDRFRSLFSHIKDAMLLIDDETRLVILANEKACRLFGWSLAEIQGKSADELRAGDSGGEDGSLPQFQRKDGTVFPADLNTSFLMLHGRPCTLQMVVDASDRLHDRLTDKREMAQKVFVNDVIHELRSPLAIISGSAQTLRRGVKGHRARSTILNFIESHTVRMGRLVDRLLDVGAAEAPKHGRKPSRVPLAEIAWGIVPAFIPLAKRRGISLKVDITEGLAVLADPADIPHLFGNLLDNALKFTPRGGSVTVCGRAEGDVGVVTVTDSGGGIAPNDLARVFDRFYRCERTLKTKGSGLGLAIVQSIVKANHGLVTVENDPSGGAAFRVALPLAQP